MTRDHSFDSQSRDCIGNHLWPVNYLGMRMSPPLKNSALHPSRVAKLSINFCCGKSGKVTTAVWQVTPCDPIWHVISRSGVVIFDYKLLYPLYFTI